MAVVAMSEAELARVGVLGEVTAVCRRKVKVSALSKAEDFPHFACCGWSFRAGVTI